MSSLRLELVRCLLRLREGCFYGQHRLYGLALPLARVEKGEPEHFPFLVHSYEEVVACIPKVADFLLGIRNLEEVSIRVEIDPQVLLQMVAPLFILSVRKAVTMKPSSFL